MGRDEEEQRSTGSGGFPGGSPRLPRLSGRTADGRGGSGIPGSEDEPSIMFVAGGFVEDEFSKARRSRRAKETVDEGPVYASFSDYSPTESLFFHPAGHDHDEADDEAEADGAPPTPQRLLGVAPDATWKEIKAAHRALLSELHPDRFVTATAAERDAAAERLAEVNLAFHTLDKERRAS